MLGELSIIPTDLKFTAQRLDHLFDRINSNER
ncbi:hypothetical protein Y590_25980 (plasmid) [Methylobacterium sp. AMS5]|nr:hypothetical protein Y590_25980 [Methylobacterium sp. AMS5]